MDQTTPADGGLGARLGHPEVLAAFADTDDPDELVVLRADGPGRALGWWTARRRPGPAGGQTVEFEEALSTSRAIYGPYVRDQRAFFAAYAAALVELVKRLTPKASEPSVDHGEWLSRLTWATHLEFVADDMVEVLADIAEGVHVLSDQESGGSITESLFLYLDAFAAIVRARALVARLRARPTS